jgi:8-oxo-dGTP diphosphatase
MPIRVLAAVITRDERYLICKRPAHKRHGDLWEFPGGKIEAGESDLEAADREMREELGISATSVEAPLFIRQDPGSEFSIEFMAVEIVGTPREIEHSALAWVSVEEILEYELAPSDRVFAEMCLVGSRHREETRPKRSPAPLARSTHVGFSSVRSGDPPAFRLGYRGPHFPERPRSRCRRPTAGRPHETGLAAMLLCCWPPRWRSFPRTLGGVVFDERLL